MAEQKTGIHLNKVRHERLQASIAQSLSKAKLQRYVNYLANLSPGLNLVELREHSSSVEMFVSLPPFSRVCPLCGSGGCTIRSTPEVQSVRHTPHASGKGVIITFEHRRFKCPGCGQSFMEPLHWIAANHRMTVQLQQTTFELLCEMYSLTQIAQQLRITPGIVSTFLDSLPMPHPTHLSTGIGIDEFKGSSGDWNPEENSFDTNKYHVNICNSDGGYIIDVLRTYKAQDITRYFMQFPQNERDNVQYYSCDMHQGFINIAKEVFPKAHICIDLFHVVSLLNDRLTDIRRRLQNECEHIDDKHGYGMLKRSARSLLKNELHPHDPFSTASRMKHLEKLFEHFPELQIGYRCVQDFHAIVAEREVVLQKAALSDWMETYLSCGVAEIEAGARSIKRWLKYLLNTFTYHRSNATCEGLNKKTKDIKRISYGVHDFERFRKRIMLICGPAHADKTPFTIFSQKREGGGKKV